MEHQRISVIFKRQKKHPISSPLDWLQYVLFFNYVGSLFFCYTTLDLHSRFRMSLLFATKNKKYKLSILLAQSCLQQSLMIPFYFWGVCCNFSFFIPNFIDLSLLLSFLMSLVRVYPFCLSFQRTNFWFLWSFLHLKKKKNEIITFFNTIHKNKLKMD